VNTKIRNLCVSGVCLACITFFILEGCKKELPQTGVSKTGQTNIKKGHKEIGLALYEKGKKAEAITEFKKAVADNTANVEVYYKLASACNDEEITNDAIAMYKKVLEIEPNHVEARYDLALVYLDEGLCEEGIRELKKVLEIDSKYEDAYYRLGDAYYDCNRKDDAVEVWKTLLKDNPEDSILHYNLGVVYRDKKQTKDAISELQKAIASDPKDDDARTLLKQLTVNKQGIKSTGNIKNKKKTEKKNKK